MRHLLQTSALGEPTRQARGDKARHLLLMQGFALADFDPGTEGPSLDRIGLIRRHLRLDAHVAALDARPRPPSRGPRLIELSRHAYRSATYLFGTGSLCWEQVAAEHAMLLAEFGHTSDAVHLRRKLLAAAIRRGRPADIARACRALAVALHSAGRCTDAHDQINGALTIWLAQVGGGNRLGRQLLRTRLQLLTACGRHQQATAVLAEYSTVFAAAGSPPGQAQVSLALTPQAEHRRCHPAVCQLRSAPPNGADQP